MQHLEDCHVADVIGSLSRDDPNVVHALELYGRITVGSLVTLIENTRASACGAVHESTLESFERCPLRPFNIRCKHTEVTVPQCKDHIEGRPSTNAIGLYRTGMLIAEAQGTQVPLPLREMLDDMTRELDKLDDDSYRAYQDALGEETKRPYIADELHFPEIDADGSHAGRAEVIKRLEADIADVPMTIAKEWVTTELHRLMAA